MSSTLTGLVKNMQLPARLMSRRLALFALADSANDLGKGIDTSIADIMHVTGLAERQASTLRTELARTGILTRTRRGGMGAGDVSTYEINVALLRAVAEGRVTYDELLTPDGREVAARAMMKGEVSSSLSVEKGDVTSPFVAEPDAAAGKGAMTAPLFSEPTEPPEVDEIEPPPADNKGAVKGAVKGATKGAVKGATNSVNGVQNPPSPPSRGEVSNYNYPTKEVNFSLPPYPQHRG